jgi:hypothetical protein
MREKIGCFLIILSCCGLCLAQQVISTAGDHYVNGTAQLSWTIGEPVISTFNNGSNILTQGMHHGLLLIDAIEEIELPGLEISAFPNPANEFVNLKVTNALTGQPDEMCKELSFQLYDMNGKVIMQNQIVSTETLIKMYNYAPSTYFLKVSIDKKSVKTFKIIKQ